MGGAAERIASLILWDPTTAGDADALLMVAAAFKKVPDDVQKDLEMSLRVDVRQSPIMLSVFDDGYRKAMSDFSANPILELIGKHASDKGITWKDDVQKRLVDLDPEALGEVLLGFAAGGDIADVIDSVVCVRGGPDMEA